MTLYVVLKLVPEPVVVDPPVAVHANVYPAVPPVAEAVHATGVPTVPVDGQLIAAARASGLTEVVTEDVAVCELASVTVTATMSVPLTVNVVENVAPVALAFATPLTVHA